MWDWFGAREGSCTYDRMVEEFILQTLANKTRSSHLCCFRITKMGRDFSSLPAPYSSSSSSSYACSPSSSSCCSSSEEKTHPDERERAVLPRDHQRFSKTSPTLGLLAGGVAERERGVKVKFAAFTVEYLKHSPVLLFYVWHGWKEEKRTSSEWLSDTEQFLVPSEKKHKTHLRTDEKRWEQRWAFLNNQFQFQVSNQISNKFQISGNSIWSPESRPLHLLVTANLQVG